MFDNDGARETMAVARWAVLSSLRYLLGPVFNISFLRTEGQRSC
jgi:hypothetical protein